MIPWSLDPAENVNTIHFAGGGGSTVGMEEATERPVDHALNHDPEALAMHQANHPHTQHHLENVWHVDPRKLSNGRPIGKAWFSPDCTDFSKAKGGKPVDRKVRSLASVAVYVGKRLGPKYAPREIYFENVEEFAEWGPLLPNGKRNPAKIGFSFRRWWSQLESLGYQMEMRQLRACNFGAPTTRNRLYIVGRRDGLPIRWPSFTHGEGLAPYRTAAECIDWSIPTPSIFLNKEQAKEWGRIHGRRPPKRPLEDATLRRLARGTMRYVVNNPRPFIVPLTHQGDDRVHGIDEPLRTITCAHRGEFAVVQAFLAKHYGGHENDGAELFDPLDTITTQDHHALVTAHIQRDFGQSVGQEIQRPLGAVMPNGGGKAALVTSSIVKLKGTCRDGQPIDAPLHTIQAHGLHYAEVRAFLIKYYGTDQDPRLSGPLHTITTKERFGLVLVYIQGEPYVIVDICMRMLTPRELFRAQGFSDNYIIDPFVERTIRGKLVTKRLTQGAQIRMCGNSVSPLPAAAIIRANDYDCWEDLEAAA